LNGLEVVLPRDRKANEIEPFLSANKDWVLEQLTRIRRYTHIRKNQTTPAGQMLFQGQPSNDNTDARSEFHRDYDRIVITSAPARESLIK
jgi:predicted metal-dependent hydrolase